MCMRACVIICVFVSASFCVLYVVLTPVCAYAISYLRSLRTLRIFQNIVSGFYVELFPEKIGCIYVLYILIDGCVQVYLDLGKVRSLNRMGAKFTFDQNRYGTHICIYTLYIFVI